MDRADIKLIVGKTGSGKTVKTVKLIADCPRVIMFDTQNKDYIDGVMFYDMNELKKFWLKVYRGRFRLIYRPLDPLGRPARRLGAYRLPCSKAPAKAAAFARAWRAVAEQLFAEILIGGAVPDFAQRRGFGIA